MKRLASLVKGILLTNVGLAKAATLSVGDPAPVFAAESTEGLIQLAELTVNGPVVLAFFFVDFTPA